MKQLFKFLLFLLCFFVLLWIANIILKSKGINIIEKREQKRIQIKEHRGQK